MTQNNALVIRFNRDPETGDRVSECGRFAYGTTCPMHTSYWTTIDGENAGDYTGPGYARTGLIETAQKRGLI